MLVDNNNRLIDNRSVKGSYRSNTMHKKKTAREILALVCELLAPALILMVAYLFLQLV